LQIRSAISRARVALAEAERRRQEGTDVITSLKREPTMLRSERAGARKLGEATLAAIRTGPRNTTRNATSYRLVRSSLRYLGYCLAHPLRLRA
jgi:hypothetical protein